MAAMLERAGIICVLLAALLLVGCVPSAMEAPARTAEGGVMVTHTIAGDDWGYPSPFAFYNRGPGYVQMSYLFDTLVWKDANGAIIPWLAEEWRASEDGLEWTFRLRQGVSWHDGQPLTAEDVAFSFVYLKDKYERGMVKWGWPLDKVQGAEVLEDEQSVVVRLTEPTAGLLTNLFGSLPIIPEHIWARVEDPLTFLDPEAAIGSSLFMLREYSKEEGRYVYEANPDFFLGRPSVDRLSFVRVKDPALALLAGEVDEAGFSGKGIAAVRQFEGRSEFGIVEGLSDWVLKLYFNCAHPPLDRRAVRQAIAYAIDRQEIVEKAQAGGALVASTGVLSPGSLWHNLNLPAYAYDRDRAREMLNAAGIMPFQTTLLTTEAYVREAEMIKNALQAVGIELSVKTADRATVDNSLREGLFDLLITGHGGGANPDLGSVNPTWFNQGYDEAYSRSRSELDEERRREDVWRMQEIVAEELPVLALWHPLMWEVYRQGNVEPFFTPGGVGGGIPTATNKIVFLPQG